MCTQRWEWLWVVDVSWNNLGLVIAFWGGAGAFGGGAGARSVAAKHFLCILGLERRNSVPRPATGRFVNGYYPLEHHHDHHDYHDRLEHCVTFLHAVRCYS